jgi:predicted GNAT family acetyltransferase
LNERWPIERRYRIVIEGVEAEMTYSRAGDELIFIDHTEDRWLGKTGQRLRMHLSAEHGMEAGNRGDHDETPFIPTRSSNGKICS